MINKLKSFDRTLLEVFSGIIALGFVAWVIGMFPTVYKGKFTLALAEGLVLAMAGAWHMNFTLERALELDEKSATRKISTAYLIRYFGLMVVLLLNVRFTTLNVLYVFLGVFMLKLAAFFQPFTHMFYNRIFHETDPIPEPLTEDEESPVETTEETIIETGGE